MAQAAADAVGDNYVLPFRLGHAADSAGGRGHIRGRLVRLQSASADILARHAYPAPVARLLGETLALTGLLSTMLKYDGIFTLQVQGDGPLRLLVADVTSDGHMRGYADLDPDSPIPADELCEKAAVPHLLGTGHLAFTVDQGENTDRYQGIVDLSGNNLSEAAQYYFRQSEQMDTWLHLAAAPDNQGHWRAAGLMLQRLPKDTQDFDNGWDIASLDEEETEEDWRRTAVLAGTMTPEELLNPDLPAERLLFSLFHEDGVRVDAARPFIDRCRCSRDRAETILKMVSKDDLDTMKVDGAVTVKCQFCAREERFDEQDLMTLFGTDA